MNKFKKLLAEYKNIASEMKVKAELYRRLDWKVRTYITSDEEFNEYKKLWSELLRLNSRAYQIFCEYRQLARTKKYRVLFALGLVRRQHSFVFIAPDKNFGFFRHVDMLSLINYDNIELFRTK